MKYIKLLREPADVTQVAYVTRDVGAAVNKLKRDLGIAAIPVLDLRIRAEGIGDIEIKAAGYFLGATMFEIIEPVGGPDAIYRDALPEEGRMLAHHHFGFFLSDERRWERLMDEIAADEVPIAFTAHQGTFDIVYTDQRRELGHYLEFCLIRADGLKRLEVFPRY